MRLAETYPEGLELYDPSTAQWVTENPWVTHVSLEPYETETILYYAQMPETPGTYTLQTEVGYFEDNRYNFHRDLIIDVMVLPYDEMLPKVTALSSTADTYISSSNRFTIWEKGKKIPERYYNFGTSVSLNITRGLCTGHKSFYDWRATLIRFDLSEIPDDAEILSAELFLYHYLVWNERISIHRMTKDWIELEATWWKPCDECEPWWSGWYQGNYVEDATDTQWVINNGWFSWDVTEDVKSFLSSTPNYGWFLKSAHTVHSDWTSISFYSKEIRKEELRPYLRIRLANQ